MIISIAVMIIEIIILPVITITATTTVIIGVTQDSFDEL